MTTDPVAEPERPTVPVDSFGLRLRIARAHAGDVSIETAAAKCDLKPAAWSTWERGLHSPPHKKAIANVIAEALGVDADWLLNGGSLTPEPEPESARPVTFGNKPRPRGGKKVSTRRNKVYCSTVSADKVQPLANVA